MFVTRAFVLCCAICCGQWTEASGAPGDLDRSFGAGGKLFANFGGICVGNAIATQPDGKIIAAGQLQNGGGFQALIARFNVDGTLDTGFGTGGKAATAVGDSAIIYALALQSDGKIVAVGDVHTNTAAYFDWLILRYNADGSLDSSFGSSGIITADFGSFDRATSVEIQPDGKVLVAGEANSQFGLARYTQDGKLDPTFGSGGTIVDGFFGPSAEVDSMVLAAGQRIIAAGQSDHLGGVSFGLGRYRPNGLPDRSFGNNGTVLTNFQACAGGQPSVDVARSIAIQPDGKILAAGASASPCGPDLLDFALARYQADGTLDPTFGSGGKVFTSFEVQGGALQLALQPDGRILVGGSVLEMYVGYEFGIIRYNSDGSLDASFGSGGRVRTFFRDLNFIAGAMTMGRDGKIICLGTDFGDFALARYETGIPVPQITSASIHGKNLTVLGTNFDAGAVILLNGVPQKTVSDSTAPGTLIGVKVGRVIKAGDSIRVQNPSGFLSQDFIFTGTAAMTLVSKDGRRRLAERQGFEPR
jgi:uncharacterized delta-60 repeat protein